MIIYIAISEFIVMNKERDIRINKHNANVSKQWKTQFPNAIDNKQIYCSKLEFLIREYNWGSSISKSLVTADNDVPIGCKTDHHQTIENSGKISTSKTSLF